MVSLLQHDKDFYEDRVLLGQSATSFSSHTSHRMLISTLRKKKTPSPTSLSFAGPGLSCR